MWGKIMLANIKSKTAKYTVSLLACLLGLIYTSTVWAQDVIQASTDNFTLSGKITESDAREILTELESMRGALLDFHNKPASTHDQHVDIFIIYDPEVFKILDVSEGFVAIYGTSIAGPRILVNGNKLSENPTYLKHSLRHEYAHHYLSKHNDFAISLWLGEGLAEYFAGYQDLGDGSYRFGVPLDSQEVLSTFPVKGWLPADRVIGSLANWKRSYDLQLYKIKWDFSPNPQPIDMYYLQSWAIVQYMMQYDNGLDRLRQLNETAVEVEIHNKKRNAHIQTGSVDGKVDPREFDSVFSLLYAQTESEFRSSVRDFILSGSITPKSGKIDSQRPAPQITVRPLSELEAEAIQYRLMAMMAGSSSIKEKMKLMRDRIALDPDLATSLLVSEAAQEYVKEFNTYASEKIEKARALSPGAKDVTMLAINIRYQKLTFQNFQNPGDFRNILKPELMKYPNDPELLIMMASSGVNETDALPVDVHNALQKIESERLAEKHPRLGTRLIALYVAKEDYKRALELALKGIPYSASSGFRVEMMLRDLIKAAEEQTQ